MYTDALNTSVEAVGTLQDQQDIYMESTAAHLQKLRTEAQKTYDILFDQNTVNDFADALTNALGIFNNFIDALGGGKQAILGLGTIATNVFSEQIGNQLASFVLNKEKNQSNRDLEILKQQILEAHNAQGETVSSEVVEKEAIELQKTLEVQKGLTQEQYNELMNLQKKIGLNEQERLNLERDLEIGRDLVGIENDVLSVYESRLKIEQEDLKIQEGISKSIASVLIQSREMLITNKNREEIDQLIVDLHDANIITDEQLLNIANNKLKTAEDQKQLEESLQQIFNEQNIKVQNQEQTVRQVIAAIEAKKKAEAGYEQQLTDENLALRNQSDEIRRQAEVRQNMQSYVQALSSTVMLLQTISSTVSIITDKSIKVEDKFKQIFSLLAFNLPIVLMNLGNIKTAMAVLTTEMGLFTSAQAASTAGIKGMAVAFAGAMGPIGWVLTALGLVVGSIAAVGAAIDRHRENFAHDTEEIIKNTNALKEESDAHKELISQFNELKQQYDNGEISKDELWDTTNNLIDAYDLESARIAALTGDYKEFAKSLKDAREAEEQELLESQQEAYNKAGKVTANDAAKGWADGISATDKYLTVAMKDYTSDVMPDEEDKKINELYEKNFGTQERNIVIDINNASEVLDFYNKLLKYQKELKEAGLESSWAFDDVTNKIKQFESGEGLQQAIEQQKALIDTTLDMSHLDESLDQEDFSERVEKLRKQLLVIIPNEDEVNSKILSYISSLNNSLIDQFVIDKKVKEQYGDEILSLFKDSINGYDVETQAMLIKMGFDFSTLNTEEGKEKLQKYVNYITGSENGVYSIPFEIQTGLNETILKGKDINKSDWESMTASVPNAEETLGSREDFNNKSIGERITLMEEFNQKIQENAQLAIQESEAFKQGAETRKEDIEAQVQGLQDEITAREEKIQWMSEDEELAKKNKERIEEETEKVKELSDEIQELESEKHEIDLTVNTYNEDNADKLLGGMIGEVVTQADQLKMAAESVGEAWTIAADDVANFAAVFPDLMADASNLDWLENGSVQLTEAGKKLLNETLENNEQIMASNKEVVLSAIEDKVTQLKADAELQRSRIQALEKYLSSELDSEANQQQLIQDLNQATMDYEETLRANNLTQEATAQTVKNNIANQGNMGLVEGLSSVNDNIAAVRDSYAHIFDANYSGKLPGYKGSSVSISSSYNKATVEDAKNNLDEKTKAFVEEAQQQLEDAKKQLSEDLLEISSMEGAAAEIRKRSNDAKKASDRVQSGQAGKEPKSKKSGGGSKGKDKKDKDEKQWKDEFDKYWKLKKAIDATDRAIQKLEKDQENLYGYQLIDSLKKENELLEVQKGNYEALLAAQNERAAALRAELGTMGVIFDASGAIVNYAEATAQALAAYNLAIQQYNAGLIDETTLGVAEKAFENFKKLLEEYDKLYYTEIQETQDKLDEIRRKELANNLKAWQTEIQVKLDKKQLKRDWNDFFKEINEDFKKLYKDLRIEQSNLLANAKTYLKNDGTINVNIQAAKEIMAEIDKMMAGGTSDKFESVSQAQEELKKFNEQIQSAAKELYDSVKQAWQNYLDGIDQVQDKLDAVQKRYEDINAQIEFQGKLIKLLYGETDTAYKLLSKYYEGMIKSTSDQIDAYKNQAEMWKAQFEKSGADINRPDSWNEDQSKLYEKWQNAQQKLNDLVIEQIELLQNDYKNTIDSIVRDLEKEITGSRLSTIQDEWEQIQKTSEGYYDNIESLYQIQTLANKFDESIASTTSLKNQQKLQKLREKEINELKAILEERKEVSEYEVKAAEAKYQIALQEIALEEAQNNKTSMKLTRNEQGNWSYQYVSDEDDVLSKRQALLDSYNDLYQLASNAYQENLEKIQELTEEFLTKQKEIKENEELTEEEKQIALDKLRSYYYERYNKLAIENDTLRNDLASATAATLKELYDQDEANLSSMTEEEQQLVKTLADEHISDFSDVEDAVKDNYKQIGDKAKQVCSETKKEWNSGAQEMINRWAADNGTSVKASVEKAYDKMKAASDKYKAAVEKLADQVEMDFGESGITGAINKAEEATNDLKDATEDLAEEGSTYIDSLRKTVEDLEEAWNKVKDAIQEAINLIEEYLNKVAEANAASASTGDTGGGDGGAGSASNSQSSSSSSSTSSSSGPSTEEEKKKKRRGGTTFNSSGAGSGGTDVSVMASGGYTGEWGEEGRLAFLHQKELVLNKEDTSNFLSGISMIRDMTSLNGSIESSILKSIANMALQITGINPGLFQNNNSNNTQSNNTFNITAEFPNANNVDDIRQAILTLPNIASQFINSNSR